jgi:3-phenylpropionate/trans-cinnamate dioxygenase ferredoxin reductase component
MTNGGMVIVGAGKAGSRACVALRENGWDGAITLIGSEAHAPYDRPPLSKSTITDEGEQVPPYLADEAVLASIKVNFIKSNSATTLDAANKTVTLSDGSAIGYEKLLIATGSVPRRLNVEAEDPSRLLYLRTFEDSLTIRRWIEKGGHAIIIGGGFIGLEIAASARKRGIKVTVVEGLARVLSRGVPEDIAAVVTERHEAAGTRIVCGHLIESIDISHGGVTISLNGGEQIKGDFAVVGIGAVPVTRLAETAGLDLDNGIAVNETLRTSDPNIYAAGDCISFPLPVYGGRRVRLESWRAAQDQGALAAANMLGKNDKFMAVPWFWSDQYDLSLQIAGLQDEASHSVRRDLAHGGFIQFHLANDGRLVAASGIGPGNSVARDIRLAEMLIAKHAHPDPAQLSDADFSLKTLLKG